MVECLSAMCWGLVPGVAIVAVRRVCEPYPRSSRKRTSGIGRGRREVWEKGDKRNNKLTSVAFDSELCMSCSDTALNIHQWKEF